MSELLKNCEQDFLRSLATVNKKIAALAGSGNPNLMLNDIKADLQEADRTLKQFESKLQSFPPDIANQYESRMKRHQDNLTQLKRTVANEDQRRQKQDLMGRAHDDQGEKVRNANEVGQDTGEMLERTLKVGLESELLANNTLSSLKQQRGKIISISEKVNDIGTHVNSANQVISRMDRRRIWMKFMMLVTIVLLVLANGVVLYIKLK